MERFINQINDAKPIPVGKLRSLRGEDRLRALNSVTGIQLSCYTEESPDHLQLLVNLKELHVFQLTCKEFERLLLHLREVTTFWRNGEYPDWGIEAFVVRECQTSPLVRDLLCELFRGGILKNVKVFHWIPREKDRSTELGEKTWTCICNAIQETPLIRLNSLCIPGNSIGDRGCKQLLKLGFDRCFSELRELNLASNRIGNAAVVELMRAMKEASVCSCIEKLDMSNNGITQRGLFEQIRECEYPRLRELRMGGNALPVFSFLDALAAHPLPMLQTLDLSKTRMAGEGMVGLALFLRHGGAPHLERLVLNGCNLGAKELAHLSYAIQDGCCASLQFLDLSNNNIKREGVELIRRMFCKEFLPNLCVLDLSDNSLGDQGIGEFGNGSDLHCMAQVKALDLSNNHITDEGASIIYLYIRNRQWRSLEHLYLDHNSFSKITLVHLLSLVDMNNHLQCIYLNEMVKQRSSPVATPSSPQFTAENSEESDTEYLKEIFGEPTQLIIPPCSLRRTSTEEDNSWTPVDAAITPISGTVGLTMDSEVVSEANTTCYCVFTTNRKKKGIAHRGARTPDHQVKSLALYRLS